MLNTTVRVAKERAKGKARAKGKGEADTELPGNVPLKMVWVPAGTFMMGRFSGEQDSMTQEDPQHSVTVQGFWMAKYELTKAQLGVVRGRLAR